MLKSKKDLFLVCFLNIFLYIFAFDLCCLYGRNIDVGERSFLDNTRARDERVKGEFNTGLRYNESPARGWWWYQDYHADKRERFQEKDLLPDRNQKHVLEHEEKQQNRTDFPMEREVADKQNRQKKFKPLSDYTYEELLRMPVSEFRELYNYYLELAVSDPTEENIYNYLNLQEVLVKKAIAFTSAYQYVQQKYADYFSGGFYPITRPGIEALQRARLAEIDAALRYVKDDFGLVLFVKRECPYCLVQAQILEYMVAEGFKVRYVDVDKFPRFASEFGVEIVPTILLVHRSGRALPIGSGVISLDEIKRRIYGVWKIWSGIESPESYSLYLFERGTPLDPKVPPPLWRQKQNR